MKSFIAALLTLSVLAYAAVANAYALTDKQCYEGAHISALAASERDSGTPRAELVAQTVAHKENYHNIALYETVMEIIRVTYDMPELTPQQHGERFMEECMRTKGQMNKKA